VKHWLIIFALTAVCLTIGWWVWYTFFDTYHLATIAPGVLYRDGVRNMHQFQLTLQKTGAKTVVSLVDDQEFAKEPFTDEQAVCRAQGIELIRVPITLGGWPDGEQLPRFLAIVQDASRQPVLVHCAQGVRRTGMMVAAYQLSVLHDSPEQAKAALLTFGHSQRTVGDVQRFIEVYDPAAKRMRQTFAVSKE